jgi:hypothetical protein
MKIIPLLESIEIEIESMIKYLGLSISSEFVSNHKYIYHIEDAKILAVSKKYNDSKFIKKYEDAKSSGNKSLVKIFGVGEYKADSGNICYVIVEKVKELVGSSEEHELWKLKETIAKKCKDRQWNNEELSPVVCAWYDSDGIRELLDLDDVDLYDKLINFVEGLKLIYKSTTQADIQEMENIGVDKQGNFVLFDL